jgi:hypothetical protein
MKSTVMTPRELQGNAGVKRYVPPSDEKTVEEPSKAVDKTRKTIATRSRSIEKSPFEGRSHSTRTEESSPLPEDEARRLPLSGLKLLRCVKVVNRRHVVSCTDNSELSARFRVRWRIVSPTRRPSHEY